jgi:hypothetical protein
MAAAAFAARCEHAAAAQALEAEKEDVTFWRTAAAAAEGQQGQHRGAHLAGAVTVNALAAVAVGAAEVSVWLVRVVAWTRCWHASEYAMSAEQRLPGL